MESDAPSSAVAHDEPLACSNSRGAALHGLVRIERIAENRVAADEMNPNLVRAAGDWFDFDVRAIDKPPHNAPTRLRRPTCSGSRPWRGGLEIFSSGGSINDIIESVAAYDSGSPC